MIAYSDQKDYVEGDFVHVLVPLGDYTQKKIILGKVTETEQERIATNVRPFERFAPVTENLNYKYDTEADEFTFVVNRDYEKVIFNKVFSEPKQYLGYHRLGIKLAIAAELKTLTQTVVSGRYRIRIQLKGIDLTKHTVLDFNDNQKIVMKPDQFIEIEDMVFINPYLTFGYCNQEKVFDIEDFALQSIVISVIQQKKEEDTFKDIDGNAVSGNNFFIKFKNIYCALGYECSDKDINTEKLFAYAVDGLHYDFSSEVTKQVNARLIKFKRDNKHMPYGENIDMDFPRKIYNGWGTYISDVTTVDSRFGIPGYIYIDNSDQKKNGLFILPININKGLQENKFIFSIERNETIVSNPIIFYNNDYVKNAELLDNIIGLTGYLSDNRESFNIYGLDNKLLNDYNENEDYYLILSYNSLNGRKIELGDTISWKIPDNKTMLIPVEPYDCTLLEDGSFLARVTENHSLYAKDTKTFKIPFRIKNIYNQNFINNTISCTFSFIDENSYLQNLEFSKSISFGFSGSEGSEYIYNLELYRTEPNGQIIKVQSIPYNETNFSSSKYTLELKIYDYNMESVIISNEEKDYRPQYKWLKDDKYADEIDLSRFLEIDDPADRIIMACHRTPTNEQLISYLPIGTLLKDNEEYNLEGCKTISYDYSGTTPYYYKGEYKLYRRGSTKLETNITFIKQYPEKLTIHEDAVQIINNKIKPYDIYIEGFTNFAVLASRNYHSEEDREDLLIFPVVIIQGQYSAMTEYIKDKIEINEDDLIEKPILGYISTKKDGIIIGKKIPSNNPNRKDSTIGLYCFKGFEKINENDEKTYFGQQIFGLDETNGLMVDGLSDNLITLKNGNLMNFTLTDCTITKLTNNLGEDLTVGDVTKPVYFLNGVPTVCNTMVTSSQIQKLEKDIADLKQQIEDLKGQLK